MKTCINTCTYKWCITLLEKKNSNMHGFVLCRHKATKKCAQERKAHVFQKKVFDLPYCNSLNLLIRSGENKVDSSFPMVRIYYI